MKVVRAEVLGMCFGVRDALTAIGRIDRPQEVTIRGELVHNEVVLAGLHTRGFRMERERDRDRLPQTSSVLITAHGVSDRERSRLEHAGKQLLDTTCPLVLRVHKAARMLAEEGFHVIVIGKHGHVEVNGVVEDLDHYDVVESAEDVKAFGYDRLGVICQSTVPARRAEILRNLIEEANPDAEIKHVDTICQPTKDHQKALERLLEDVDAIVVVGGRHSNNTRELVSLCRERGVPALHVADASELDREWLLEFDSVGLTAGTSTLDSTIDEVYRELLKI